MIEKEHILVKIPRKSKTISIYIHSIYLFNLSSIYEETPRIMFGQTSGYLVTQSNWCMKLTTTDSRDGKKLNMRRRTWLLEQSSEREGELQRWEVSYAIVQRRSSQRWAEQRGNHGVFEENERFRNEKRPHFYGCELTGLISLKYKYIYIFLLLICKLATAITN